MNAEFKNLIVFLILMSGRDVLTKAPSYIGEKFDAIGGDLHFSSEPKAYLLDQTNTAIYEEYLSRWNS